MYRTAHGDVMRRRLEWVEQPTEEHLALWWVEEGHVPSVDEGKGRLAALRDTGPSADAFTFRHPFGSPEP